MASVRRQCMSQDESTYIFTVVFCPINLIARTYPRPISAACITRLLRWRSLLADCAFRSSAGRSEGVVNPKVSAGASCIVCIEELTLGSVRTSLLHEIDSRYAEAWYRKLSRCRMSRFTTPFGFGVSPLFFLPIGVQAWRAKLRLTPELQYTQCRGREPDVVNHQIRKPEVRSQAPHSIGLSLRA